ncbi:hypothetical protein [Nocardioides sp. R-C-SC26]|uniref:hypothetical protein n=1 Tax=Nocardioides sp. R-C-SC26 TaxID=2870414 RepID=UPI001E3105C2|nr:hypothetical protein [Nocardioides sp. R-C-SC26]
MNESTHEETAPIAASYGAEREITGSVGPTDTTMDPAVPGAKTDPEATTVLPGAPSAERAGRRPMEIGYLVMGVAFLGLTGIWALIASDTVQGENISWLLPLPWVFGGLAGLVGLIARDRRRARA